jgi:hypothetical protein
MELHLSTARQPKKKSSRHANAEELRATYRDVVVPILATMIVTLGARGFPGTSPLALSA